MKRLFKLLFRLLSFGLGLIAAVFVGYQMYREYRKREQLKATPEFKEVKRQRRVALDLTPRQKEVYRLIETSKKVEMRDILSRVKGVTERTLRRDLLKLQEQGLITKKGSTKSAQYLLKDNA
jgi:predicted HTH transcriptional regulator